MPPDVGSNKLAQANTLHSKEVPIYTPQLQVPVIKNKLMLWCVRSIYRRYSGDIEVGISRYPYALSSAGYYLWLSEDIPHVLIMDTVIDPFSTSHPSDTLQNAVV